MVSTRLFVLISAPCWTEFAVAGDFTEETGGPLLPGDPPLVPTLGKPALTFVLASAGRGSCCCGVVGEPDAWPGTKCSNRSDLFLNKGHQCLAEAFPFIARNKSPKGW
jgi:hypothetical protein